jgi:hypothetical protein
MDVSVHILPAQPSRTRHATLPLIMKHSLLALALLPVLAVAAVAQTQTTKKVKLPKSNPVPRTSPLPFGQNKIHYQQWYEGRQFSPEVKQSVRFVGLEFFGAMPAGSTLDIEVTLANASSSLSGVFAQNFVSNKVTVIPRRKIPVAGAITKLPFVIDWKFDGTSNVVLDIKMWDNGHGKPVTFAAESTILTFSNVKRQYFIGNPNAATANSSGTTGHHGLATRFLFQEGGTYDYGAGCKGGNNITPVGSANAVPMPGLGSYEQLLTKAGSSYPCIFILGISKTKWGTSNLPFNLAFIFAPNCNLLVSPDLYVFTTTVGGGPGTGSAKIKTPVPPIGNLGGVKVYSQWLILDKASPNANLSATAGLMHVVGS